MNTKLVHNPFTTEAVALISVDGLRADRLRENTMPYLCELFRKGILFRRAYSNYPYTPAAHATMLTSLYACNHGKTDQSWVLSPHIRSVAQILQHSDVDTAAVVSATPLLKERSGFERGFRTYIQDDRSENPLRWQWIRVCDRILREGLPDLPFMTKTYLTAQSVLAKTNDLVRRKDGAGKLFAFVHLMDLHDPRNLLGVNHRDYSLLDAVRVMRRYYRHRYNYEEPYLSKSEVEVYRAIYDANVRMVDKVLSSFIEDLLADHITVILTSDHGENAYERKTHDTEIPYPGKTLTLYETEVHVPLVLLDARIEGPVVVENAVSLVDLAPTIVDLLRVKENSQFQGSPLWQKGADSPVFMERLDWYSRKEAAWLRWPWKLIITPGPLSGDDHISADSHIIELYNLETDPGETRNLYWEQHDRTQELIGGLMNFLSIQTDFWRECHREPSEEDDAVIRERLRMLGYID